MWCSARIRAGCVRFHGRKSFDSSRDAAVEKLIQDGRGWISHCSSQISEHPCKPSACADPAETGESKGRAQLPAVLRELHLPMSPMWCSPAKRRGPGMHGEPPGNAQLRSCPPTCKTQTQKPGQTSQWTFLPTDIRPHGYSRRQSLQQVLSSQSYAGSWGVSDRASLPSQHLSSGFFPSVHAPEHSVDEGESEP